MGFRNILIGFIFFLWIPVVDFDILPDFIGYIFIARGLYQIRRFDWFFKVAMVLSIILSFLSLPLFIQSIIVELDLYTPLFLQSFYRFYYLNFSFNVILFYGLEIVFGYFIFIGISKNASKLGYNFLSQRAGELFVIFSCFALLNFALIYFEIPSSIYQALGIIEHLLGFFVAGFEIYVLIQSREYLE